MILIEKIEQKRFEFFIAQLSKLFSQICKVRLLTVLFEYYYSLPSSFLDLFLSPFLLFIPLSPPPLSLLVQGVNVESIDLICNTMKLVSFEEALICINDPDLHSLLQSTYLDFVTSAYVGSNVEVILTISGTLL